jgi:hypothetical protein
METEEKECKNCGTSEWAKFGFVPTLLFFEGEGFERIEVCNSCGATRTLPPEQEDIDEAIDRYLEFVREHELATEGEIEYLESIRS